MPSPELPPVPAPRGLLERAQAALERVPPAVLICVIVGAVFLRALGNGFVDWDDVQYVLDNPALRGSWLNALAFSPGYYHPLTTLTYKAEFTLFGLAPLPYHFTSLVLHLVNCVSAFYLLTALGARRASALIGALLFGVHPLHVEPAVWISGRKELLWGMFSCWSLISYLKFIDTDRKRYYLSSLLLLFFAVLSKPFAIVLPGVFLLADYYRGRRFDFRLLFEKVPFLAMALPILTLSTGTSDFLLKSGDAPFSLPGVLASAGLSAAFYAQKFLLPVKLSGLYASMVPPSEAVARLAFLLAAVLAAYAAAKAALRAYSPGAPAPAGPGLGRKLAFGLGFFLITVLPALLITPPADRYVYFPALGLFFLYAEAAVWLYDTVPRRGLVAAAVAAHLLALGAASALRIPDWKNSMALWTNVLKNQTGEHAAYYGRGNAFAAAGEYEKALLDLDRCLELEPQHWKAHSNRGRILAELKQFDGAVEDFDAALKIAPREPRLYLNRGNTYLLKGDPARAAEDFGLALALAPEFAPALAGKLRAEAALRASRTRR